MNRREFLRSAMGVVATCILPQTTRREWIHFVAFNSGDGQVVMPVEHLTFTPSGIVATWWER